MRYIYITTNLLNGKCYLGQRKVPQGKTIENDAYLGSGTLLLKAIKKYGKENFAKEIIHVCKTQKEADFLEIKEIKQRRVIENPDKWYNLDAGGQYGRSELHSSLISKAVKSYYSDDENYTKFVLKVNKIKYFKGLNPNITSKAFVDLDRLKKKLISINNKRNREEKNRVSKLIYNAIKDNRKNEKRIGSTNGIKAVNLKYPNIKELMLKGLREYHANQKSLGLKSFSNEVRNKFALAKLKASNNLVGEYIVNNYNIDYRTIHAKVKKLITTRYKDKDNMYLQLDKVISLIREQTEVNIDKDLLIDLCTESRRLRGVD